MSDIREGKSYSIKAGDQRTGAGTQQAQVIQIVKQGRGHTVHYTAGGKTLSTSMGRFRSLLSA